MLSAGTCDTTGTCHTAISLCPNNLACNDAGVACLTDCSTTLDCGADSYCNAGTCEAKEATGTCTEDDDCISGICGNFGRMVLGYCCTGPCSTTDVFCGAIGCSPTGACVYPDKTASCGGPPKSCSGSTADRWVDLRRKGLVPVALSIDYTYRISAAATAL